MSRDILYFSSMISSSLNCPVILSQISSSLYALSLFGASIRSRTEFQSLIRKTLEIVCDSEEEISVELRDTASISLKDLFSLFFDKINKCFGTTICSMPIQTIAYTNGVPIVAIGFQEEEMAHDISSSQLSDVGIIMDNQDKIVHIVLSRNTKDMLHAMRDLMTKYEVLDHGKRLCGGSRFSSMVEDFIDVHVHRLNSLNIVRGIKKVMVGSKALSDTSIYSRNILFDMKITHADSEGNINNCIRKIIDSLFTGMNDCVAITCTQRTIIKMGSQETWEYKHGILGAITINIVYGNAKTEQYIKISARIPVLWLIFLFLLQKAPCEALIWHKQCGFLVEHIDGSLQISDIIDKDVGFPIYLYDTNDGMHKRSRLDLKWLCCGWDDIIVT